MFEKENKPEFIKNLIAQDPPPADKQQQHKEALLKKIEHRMRQQKAVIIAIYTALILIAFGAFMLQVYTDNVVHSICWGTVSLHILLWSLVYILRGISMEMEGLIEKRLGNDERRRNKNQNLFLTILAIVLFVLGSWFLYRSFFLTNARKAAQTAVSILWPVIFILINYSFRTATLIGMLWFEYKKMELKIPKTKEQDLKSQDE
ncbi:MAG: hypothetical protein ACYSU4_18015 [Planctomycetota bacterium]|jgi:hypothetical protein